MRDPEYLAFIRARPCSLSGHPVSDPHHAIKRLRGMSEAGLGTKGPDYFAIPMCRRCHRELHDGKLTISREEVLEICAINLICYIQQLKAPTVVQRINAKRQENEESEPETSRRET
ncbi:MAG TPA: hypothetical protein VFZ27_19065 [Terriglobia bacterium]|nr:hypothetical protein [Terriglobia bacterium]